MNREAAVKLFFEHNRIATRTVNSLSKYTPKMSITEFAVAAGMGVSPAYSLARVYGLEFKCRSISIRTAARKRNEELYVSKWDSSKTIGENAKVLGISGSLASRICRGFKLEAKQGHLKDKVINQIKRMDEFAVKGLTDSQISRVMGVSREWIRQLKILKEAK